MEEGWWAESRPADVGGRSLIVKNYDDTGKSFRKVNFSVMIHEPRFSCQIFRNGYVMSRYFGTSCSCFNYAGFLLSFTIPL